MAGFPRASTVLFAAAVALGIGACASDKDRRADRGRALPVSVMGAQSQPSGLGGLLGRLNPLQLVAARPGPYGASARASGRLCGIRGIQGQEIPPITGEIAGCGIARPVRVTHVDGVALSQGAIMDCQTAAALHSWVRQSVQPAVGRRGGGVAGLQVAAHYTCRTRNHQPNAAVSEHGRGRAIDISAIHLANGSTISVLEDWGRGRNGRILARVHNAACGPFGTTLGPGSDGMHEDHFHYDTAHHRGGPVCR